MAARKKAARKKATRSRAGSGRGRLGIGAALGSIELPPTLRDYARQVRTRLDRLERELTRASVDVRRRAARLLREASHQLGRLEAQGEAGWRRLAASYRRQLVDLLRRLERAVSPQRARGRSPARGGTRRRATKGMRSAAAAKDSSA